MTLLPAGVKVHLAFGYTRTVPVSACDDGAKPTANSRTVQLQGIELDNYSLVNSPGLRFQSGSIAFDQG